jgi:hypothetical protein
MSDEVITKLRTIAAHPDASADARERAHRLAAVFEERIAEYSQQGLEADAVGPEIERAWAVTGSGTDGARTGGLARNETGRPWPELGRPGVRSASGQR